MAKLVALIVVLSLLLIFPKSAFAAGFTLSSTQTSINVGDEFNVNVNFSINTANGTIYYLRGVFYQVAGNYCGYTWNGNTWYNGPYTVNNGWQQLLAVTVNQNSWSGQLKAKIDPSDGNCQNSGNYYFKIQRYTNGGSSSFDDQNSLSLNVSIPTPIPTPTNTPTPSPSPSPTPSPQKSPSPSPQPAILSTINPSTKPQAIDPPQVLAESSKSATPSASPTPPPPSKPESFLDKIKNNSKTAIVLVGSGLILIGLSSAFYVWYSKLLGKGQSAEKNQNEDQ